MKYHEPVLLQEVLTYLEPTKDKTFIDCTLGDGGHSLELLKHNSVLIAIDISQQAIDRFTNRINLEVNAKRLFIDLETKLITIRGNFKNIEQLAHLNNIKKVNGILFDLGYSSYQLDEGQLGLSFQKDELLDMRMDPDLSVTAADLINKLPQQQLEKIIREYGGERLAKRFTQKIIQLRDLKKFQTTKDLADLLRDAAPSGYERGRIHPATRTFQALRIAVNDELENLKIALPRAARLLLPGGRLIVISFQSLEDKIAKSLGQRVQPDLKLKQLTKKPVEASDEEVAKNIRARSAKMRVYERI